MLNREVDGTSFRPFMDLIQPDTVIAPSDVTLKSMPVTKRRRPATERFLAMTNKEYDHLTARLISLLDRDILPLPTFWDLERHEQRIAIAVQDATGMTSEHWAKLDIPSRRPWLERTIEVSAKRQKSLAEGKSANEVESENNSRRTDQPSYTLGELLQDLASSESAFAANTKTTERIRSQQGGLIAHSWEIQSALLKWQPDSKTMPGIHEIELICDERFGSRITLENIRRLRAELCHLQSIDLDTADSMTLKQIVGLLRKKLEYVNSRTSEQNAMWDLFISHASEDKEDVAEPLARMFESEGLKVWFDKSTLTVGDSLRRSIDHGLANCRFGLVVLSPHFFEKEWTKRELDGLVAMDNGPEKRILPVWHNVSKNDVVRFSPTLADKLGVPTSKGLDHVVREIMRVFGSESKTHASTGSKKRSISSSEGKSKKTSSVKRTGSWIMLGERFFLAESVRHQSEGKVEVVLSPTNGEEEADLASFRPTQFNNRRRFPFAVNNDAHLVQVDQVTTETKLNRQQWTLSLTAIPPERSNANFEMTVNGVSPEEIARRRAGRILLNDPPPADRRGHSTDSIIEANIEGYGDYVVKECVVASVFRSHGQSSDWKDFARLKSVFLLKMTGTVEHVLVLSIGTLRNNKVAIEFQGRRAKKYSNVSPATIEISGSCSLNG